MFTNVPCYTNQINFCPPVTHVIQSDLDSNDFLNLSLFLFFRLWGDHGQSALESACVCLVNVSAVGTEILKNMILPGKYFM